jgi:hypothetical protein
LSGKWGVLKREMAKFAGHGRQILPPHGQFLPSACALSLDWARMIFRRSEKIDV